MLRFTSFVSLKAKVWPGEDMYLSKYWNVKCISFLNLLRISHTKGGKKKTLRVYLLATEKKNESLNSVTSFGKHHVGLFLR